MENTNNILTYKRKVTYIYNNRLRTKDENGSIENINYDENDSLNVCLVQLKRKRKKKP